MAGVQRQSIGAAICTARNKGLAWAKIGPLHFRKAGDPAAEAAAATPATATPTATPTARDDGKDPHEAQPRRRGNLAPINPNIVGAAAPITHAEVRPRGPARLVRNGLGGGDE